MPTEREKLAYELEGLSLQEAADYILANYDPKVSDSTPLKDEPIHSYPNGEPDENAVSADPSPRNKVAKPTVLGNGELREKIHDELAQCAISYAKYGGGGRYFYTYADQIVQLFASQAPKLDDSELREQLWHILGGKPKPEGFWQEFLYAAAREYEGDARRYKQLEKLEQLFASHSAAAFERGRIAEAKVCEKAKRHDTAAALLSNSEHFDYERLKKLEVQGIEQYREMRKAPTLSEDAVLSFINQLSPWNLKTTGASILQAYVAAAQGQAAGCPCNYIEPCSQACSCANPVMSGGCQRCCKYGSLEQRREAARQLAGCLTPAAQERAVAQGMRRARDIVLRRTEIPKDAKNPTRDYVVILGEEIAELIERELTAQPEKQQGENHGS